MICITRGTDPVNSGAYQIAVPRDYKRDGTVRGVIYVHGAGSDEMELTTVTWPDISTLLRQIALYYPVLSVKAGGDTWGNDTGIARIAQAKTLLQGTWGAKAGTVFCIGTSHGHTPLASWVGANLASCAALVGILPVSDLNDMKTNNRGGYAAAINTAYGGTYVEATHGAAHNPRTMAQAGTLNGLAYKAFAATDDLIAVTSTVDDVVAGIGATASRVNLTGGHASASIGQIVPADLLAFLDAHA